ncbi:hypothetical protein SCLCIDRAFT_137455, partial [Scleroderma citrinum Foug A]
YISVIEAFPFPNQKEDICWTCLELATKNSEEMKNTLRSAEGDTMTKRDLIDYVWTGGSQIHGELMHKAHSIVPHAYGLARGLGSRNTMEEVNKWLMNDLNFLHPDINISALACDEGKPWQNEVFTDLIKAQWWGPKGDAIRLGVTKENVYANVPFPMLALVACAVSLLTFSASYFHCLM